MRKSTLLSAVFALLLLAAAPQAHAQTDISVGPRVGYETDSESIFIGADGRIGVATLPIRINPTFDYFFVEDQTVSVGFQSVEVGSTLLQITANGLYEFGIDNTTFTPYAGAGLSYTRISADDVDINDLDLPPGVDPDDIPDSRLEGGSETDVALNLLGGAEFTEVNGFVPFAQAEFVVGGDFSDLFKITAGILFNVGS